MWEWHKRSLRVNTRLQRESAINTIQVKSGGAKHTSLFSCLYPFPSDDVSPNVVILYCYAIVFGCFSRIKNARSN